GRRVRIILDGLQIPLRASGHGIHGDTAQETDLAIGAGADQHAFNQRVQVRRISLASGFDADQIAIRVVLIAVDGIANFPQCLMKLCFPGPNNGYTNDGHGGRSEDKKNGRSDDKFEQSNASFGARASSRRVIPRRNVPSARKSSPRVICNKIRPKVHAFRIPQFSTVLHNVVKDFYLSAGLRTFAPCTSRPSRLNQLNQLNRGRGDRSLCYDAVSPSKLSLPYWRPLWAASSA